nr:hypothetical protein [Candidatus Sigynarchaeota archaeon]
MLRFLSLGERVEDLFLLNSYYLVRNMQKSEWKVDWKSFTILFVLADTPSSIADLIKAWPFFRHYKDISPRLQPLMQFGLVSETIGPKNAKILQTTQKGKFVAAFFYYMLSFENDAEFKLFTFLANKFRDEISLAGFETVQDLMQSLRIIKGQLPALMDFMPQIMEHLSELEWRFDYKVLLIPLYLLDGDDQSYTDLINNYPMFGYYRELKQRTIPLVSLGLIHEEKAGKKGNILSLTRKGRYFLCFLGYLMNFPQLPMV